MNKFKVAIVFVAGITLGGFFSPLAQTSANSNIVVASVEWVNSLINPLNAKVSKLEQEVASLRQALADTDLDVPSLPSKVYVQSLVADIHTGALKEYKVASSKPVGEVLNVAAEHTSEDGKFYRVEYAPGKFGWISVYDISYRSVAKPTTVTIKTATTVYSGADTTGYRNVARLSSGQSVKYLSAFKNSKKQIWLNVSLSNGTKGWVQAINGEVK